MLTGEELLAQVAASADLSRDDLIRACGYAFLAGDKERINRTAFYQALLEAKGIYAGAAPLGGRGRRVGYRARVQFNGNLMVGRCYTRQMGYQPGDEFEIKLSAKGIRLVPLAAEGDGAEEELALA